MEKGKVREEFERADPAAVIVHWMRLMPCRHIVYVGLLQHALYQVVPLAGLDLVNPQIMMEN